MNPNYLDFEQPIAELEVKIEELQLVGSDNDINIGEELNNTASVIKKTGIFNNIDKLYGESEVESEEGEEGEEVTDDVSMDTGDDVSMDIGGDTGGEDLELADIGESGLPLILEKKNNNNRFISFKGFITNL